MTEKIKLGFCTAYDWPLLEFSIPMIYEYADTIHLTMDKDNISWSGNHFPFDENRFGEFIKRIDSKKKIKIVRENFSIPGLSPMGNEVRQRNIMGEIMGNGGWHIQLDCDEYFLNFKGFVNYLHSLPDQKKKFNVCCSLVTLIKQIESGFLYVLPKKKKQIENIQIATLHPVYEAGRRNGNFNFYTNFKIVHQSWARNKTEILMKLQNWGHRTDIEINEFLKFWEAVNENNYKSLKNFHPIDKNTWPYMELAGGKDINELMISFNQKKFLDYSDLDLLIKNSRMINRMRHLIDLLS